MASSESTPPGSSCPQCGSTLPDGGTCLNCAKTGMVFSDAPTRQPGDRPLGDEPTLNPMHGADTEPSDYAGPERIDHYKILRELGTGGMGAVYLAHDSKMNRNVALKVLSRHQAPSAKADRRFEQEAWIAGKLDHPNLVKVYERGTWEELSYYSMEVVEGGSLHDVITNLRDKGKDETRDLELGTSQYVHWALRKVIEAARGLDYAHRQGVVHRDVKPMNLLLSKELDAIKIADFGLALDSSVTRMTTAGKVMGTVTFMAPEQILGKQDHIDGRTDVYALGVTLFELLTLELPYSGKTEQLYVSQVLGAEVRRASKINAMVSRDLETVLHKAMEKARRDRYQTMGAFADDLDNVLHLRPIEARPTGPVKRATKWVRRKPVHAALLATLLVSVPTFAVVGARAVQGRIAAREARIEKLLGEARWLEERQRYDEVLARTTVVLEMDGANMMALRHRAMARFELSVDTKDPARASELQEQALADITLVAERLPATSWPYALKAWMLTEAGRDDEARAAEEVARRNRAEVPSDEELSEQARLAMSAERYDEAVELFTELLFRRPDRVQAITSRAKAYEEEGDTDSAVTDYRVAVGLDPGAELAYVDLARISIDRSKLDDGERYLDRSFEIDRENGFALEILGYLMIQRGITQGMQGDRAAARISFDRAEESSRRALEQDADLKFVEINLANSLTERNRLLDEPDPELVARAVESYRKVLEQWDDLPAKGQGRDVYVAALANICDAEIQLERLDQALAVCSRFTVVFPDNAVGFYNLAGVYAMLDRGDEALAALRRDLQLGDTDWEYLEGDRWFMGLRENSGFVEIVEEMKQRASDG